MCRSLRASVMDINLCRAWMVCCERSVYRYSFKFAMECGLLSNWLQSKLFYVENNVSLPTHLFAHQALKTRAWAGDAPYLLSAHSLLPPISRIWAAGVKKAACLYQRFFQLYPRIWCYFHETYPQGLLVWLLSSLNQCFNPYGRPQSYVPLRIPASEMRFVLYVLSL